MEKNINICGEEHQYTTSSFLFFSKGALSSLSQFLATKILFKMMKNAFYFTLKALLILKIFKFLA